MGVFVCRAATAIVLPPRGWRRCLLTCWPALRLCTPWKYQVTLPTSPFFLFFFFFFCIVSTFWRLWRFRWGGGAKCFRNEEKKKQERKAWLARWRQPGLEGCCGLGPSQTVPVSQCASHYQRLFYSLQYYLTLSKTVFSTTWHYERLCYTVFSTTWHCQTLIQSLVLLDAIRLLYSL